MVVDVEGLILVVVAVWALRQPSAQPPASPWVGNGDQLVVDVELLWVVEGAMQVPPALQGDVEHGVPVSGQDQAENVQASVGFVNVSFFLFLSFY